MEAERQGMGRHYGVWKAERCTLLFCILENSKARSDVVRPILQRRNSGRQFGERTGTERKHRRPVRSQTVSAGSAQLTKRWQSDIS